MVGLLVLSLWTESFKGAFEKQKTGIIMSKRYVFFTGTLGKGGAERVVSILSRKMAEEGHQVEILLYYDYEVFYDIHPDVKITFVERETGSKSLKKNYRFIRRFFKEKADTVIAFMSSFGMIAVGATVFTDIKVIAADRSDPRQAPANKMKRKLRNILYRYADRVVTQTENNKSYFSKKVRKKCDVIPNPVDMGEKYGQALRVDKEKIVVTAGRLIPAKNHKMMMDAFADVHKDFPEHKLIIYGDGSYRGELEKFIEENGYEDFVSLPGAAKDIFDKISSAELFVLSSNCEGMPNALLEAMCLGLPVVSTKVSGAPDVIVHEENGLLTDLRNKEQFAEAMKKMLTDKKFSLECAKNATKLADRLTIDKIYRQWMETCQIAKK